MIYKWNEKQLYTEERSITDFQTLQEDKQESIIGDTIPINRRFHFIGKFGLITLVKFLKDLLSTTKMTIPSIMNYQTLNSWENPSIVECIAPAQRLLGSQYEILKKLVRVRNFGMPLMKLKNGKRKGIQKDSL